MTVPRPSWDEQTVIDLFEQAAPAPESLRYRIAKTLFDYDNGHEDRWDGSEEWVYFEWADAVLETLRGEKP